MAADINIPGLGPEEVLLLMEEGAAAGLNKVANIIFERSQTEVPRSTDEKDAERHPVALWETGLAPINHAEYAAVPGKLAATVSYGDETHSYAVPQHEGQAIMHRETGEVEWHVQQYSTPGTKSKYLEDPFKAELPGLEAVIAEEIRLRLGE